MKLILTTDIQKGLEICKNTEGALLLDVRTPEEYAQGHVPGSVNAPLGTLEEDIWELVPEPATPLFLYCQSGNRSIQAASVLQELGYANASSIGGIDRYQGDVGKCGRN